MCVYRSFMFCFFKSTVIEFKKDSYSNLASNFKRRLRLKLLVHQRTLEVYSSRAIPRAQVRSRLQDCNLKSAGSNFVQNFGDPIPDLKPLHDHGSVRFGWCVHKTQKGQKNIEKKGKNKNKNGSRGQSLCIE